MPDEEILAGRSYDKALNYLIQSQQCDLAAYLTEEMNKYPKGSLERTLLKSIRFGVAYGRPDSTVNIHTDVSPEEMMSRFKAMFKAEEQMNTVNEKQCRPKEINHGIDATPASSTSKI